MDKHLIMEMIQNATNSIYENVVITIDSAECLPPVVNENWQLGSREFNTT